MEMSTDPLTALTLRIIYALTACVFEACIAFFLSAPWHLHATLLSFWLDRTSSLNDEVVITIKVSLLEAHLRTYGH